MLFSLRHIDIFFSTLLRSMENKDSDKSVMGLPMYGTYQDDSESPKSQAEVLALSAKKKEWLKLCHGLTK